MDPIRMLRGGAWNNTNENNFRWAYRNNNIGFRVVRRCQYLPPGS
jgi:hypothetical protein